MYRILNGNFEYSRKRNSAGNLKKGKEMDKSSDKIATAIDIITDRAIKSGLKEDYYKAVGAIDILRMAGMIPEAFADILLHLLDESLKEKERKKGKGHREFKKLWGMKVG